MRQPITHTHGEKDGKHSGMRNNGLNASNRQWNGNQYQDQSSATTQKKTTTMLIRESANYTA